METGLLVVAFALLVAAVLYALTRHAGGEAATPQLADTLINLNQTLGDLRLEAQSLNVRLEGVERANENLRGDVTRVQVSLESTGSVASGLREATESIRREIGHARESLTKLQAAGDARHELESRTAESVRRLETVIAGTQSKGAAGENIIDLVFSQLPPEWQARDVRLGNRAVEFGLRLPNGLVLPIDSKWPASELVEKFAAAENPAEAQRLRREIERAVRSKMQEVRKYLDPDLTHSFGIAVVPDAVYDLCGDVRVEAFRMNVVLVGYSMFVPYLLLVFQTVLASSHDIDVERLARALKEADEQLRDISGEVEGRLSRAIAMLGNSRDDLRGHVARVQGSLGSVRVREAEAQSSPALEESSPTLFDAPWDEDATALAPHALR